MKKEKKLKIKFVGAKSTDELPKVALFVIDKTGFIKKLGLIEDEITPDFLKKQTFTLNFGFGPDVDEEEIDKASLITFSGKEKIEEWERTGIIEINPTWRNWILPFTCVYGKVQKCTPIWWPPIFPLLGTSPSRFGTIRPASDTINPTISRRCAPICDAIVEIYEKTCCCNPIITDCIPCRLIEWIQKQPPFPIPELINPDLPPLPFPPGPDPPPIRDPKLIKKALASGEKPLLGNISERTIQDAIILNKLSLDGQAKYLEEHYYLYPMFCNCSTRKVGETFVNTNGEFSHCFLRRSVSENCKVTYYYKVKQFQGDRPVYIYDGSEVNEYFRPTEEANISTWRGQACEPEIKIPGGEGFVFLEKIGHTQSHKLRSPHQIAPYQVEPIDPDSGLLKSYDTSEAGIGTITDAPWAETLSFRFSFGGDTLPDNAKFYKVSVVQAGSNGKPKDDATPVPLTNDVVWRKVEKVTDEEGSPFRTTRVHLGPDKDGLVMLPSYHENHPEEWTESEGRAFHRWLSGYPHQTWDTRDGPLDPIMDGKYLVILEIFDTEKRLLRPRTAEEEEGIEAEFVYGKWESIDTFEPVNHASLTHLFHINNIQCYADIVDYRHGGEPSSEVCQYICGDPKDTFSVGFHAFHRQGFMAKYLLHYKKGLSTDAVFIQDGTDNAPPTPPLDPSSSNAEESVSMPFSVMLGSCPDDPDSCKRCAFAIHLYVWAKHTNGSDRIRAYDKRDMTAVSLDQSCTPPE